MKRASSSSPFFTSRTPIIGALAFVLALLVVSLWTIPANASPTFPIGTAVSVGTSGSQVYPGNYVGSCTYLSYLYDFWWDTANNNLYFSASTDGVSWSTGQNITHFSTIGTPATTNEGGYLPMHIACNGNTMVVVWTSATKGTPPVIGATNFVFYRTGTLSGGTVTIGSKTTGPTTNSGAAFKQVQATYSLQIGCVSYWNGIVWYCLNSGSTGFEVLVGNNLVEKNFTNVNWGGQSTAGWPVFLWNGNTYLWYIATGCSYGVSGDGVTWTTSPTTISATYCAGGDLLTATGTVSSGSFYIPSTMASAEYVLQFNNAGTLVASNLMRSAQGGAQAAVVGDGTGNFVYFECTSLACKYTYTVNGFASIATLTSFTLTGAQFGSASAFVDINLEPVFSSTMEAFGLESASTSATFTVYNTMVGIVQTSSAVSNIITVGQCPIKNTATFTLVNNTEYFYTGSVISPATITTVSTFVAQVTSATAPQTLRLGIYATLSAGSVSVSNPLFLIGAFSVSLTAGTTNNVVNWAPAIGTTSTIVGPIPTGATIGIAVMGTNKIKINDSSLAGMSTGATSGGALASTYTALSATGTQLYLCMNLNYQTITTATTTVTSTTTTTTGATTTVSGLSNPVLANSNFMLAIIVILGPSLILAAATKSLWGGILGALLGGAVGAFIGFLPFWVPVVIVVGCITVLFFARGGGGDKM